MHTDENKRYDKRNIDSNLRKGEVTLKDYEVYLSRLPDVSDKVFTPEEEVIPEGEEKPGSRGSHGAPSKKGAAPSKKT